MAVMLQS